MKGMSLIVKTISSWVKVLIIMFGIYITLTGHLTPGGGFGGGVILASAYILLMLAYGKDYAEDNLPIPLASKLESVGAILFAFVAISGAIVSGSFFLQLTKSGGYFEPTSAISILLSNLFIGVKVGASLFLVVLLLSSSKFYGPKSAVNNGKGEAA
jgi:multisubunit Na+/H+ antiporter MnhB subunit